MLLARHSALVKLFELSSCPAALVGPNALKPAALRSSTIPAAIGASGPTTTKSTALFLQKSITAAWSAISSATHSASRAIPALPGAHQSFVTRGEAAIFHARACSRPPEPSKRIFMNAARPELPRDDADGLAWRRPTATNTPDQVWICISRSRLPPRGRDDFLQRRDMAGKRASPGRRG